ncbi:microfibril-associated glycoprotein 4-like [Thalassophryne amazonica]|uniref:microfibril-associated glycoprotein 4-like n=1 Tax=Thalassophryne amazonica TaxID=390379 RepID=UPI00147093EC|nr:microfibril-associated glycoprotein 4-like [Thalassophryne amazonica]
MPLQGPLAGVLVFLVASVQSDSYFLPVDCDDIYRHNNRSPSGVCTIFPGGPTTPIQVYCDMATDGGRWTVFTRRIDGTENFYRPWAHYKTGFGNVAGEYWLRLENILVLTMRKKNELRVDMESWEGYTAHTSYSSFSIGPEITGYQLNLGSYVSGAAGDSLAEVNNMKLTMFDKDQDLWPKNCAQHFLGGFWYNACHSANPTGMYAPHGAIAFNNVHVICHSWMGTNYSLKTISLKIRPIAKCPCNTI